MNSKHIVLDIEIDNLSGAFCCYCGKAVGSSYNREKDIYEFKCLCPKAQEELQILKTIEEAENALQKFYGVNQNLIESKILEIKKNNFTQYAAILRDMYSDYMKQMKGEN